MRLQVDVRLCRKSGSMSKSARYRRCVREYRGIPAAVASGYFPSQPSQLPNVAAGWGIVACFAGGRYGHYTDIAALKARHREGAAWRRLVFSTVIRNWFPNRAIGQGAPARSRPRPRMSADEVIVRLAIDMIGLLAIPFLLALIGFVFASGASVGG
jgi:hypothetical protein